MNAGPASTPRSGRVFGAVGLMLLLAACAGEVRAADPDTIIFPTRPSGGLAAPAAAVAGGFNSLTLVVAAVLAGVGGWSVWRHRRRPGGAPGRPALAVEETRPLGNRQYLVVANYEGRRFLLGVCPGRIEMLAPLPADPAPRPSVP